MTLPDQSPGVHRLPASSEMFRAAAAGGRSDRRAKPPTDHHLPRRVEAIAAKDQRQVLAITPRAVRQLATFRACCEQFIYCPRKIANESLRPNLGRVVAAGGDHPDTGRIRSRVIHCSMPPTTTTSTSCWRPRPGRARGSSTRPSAGATPAWSSVSNSCASGPSDRRHHPEQLAGRGR